MPVSDAHGAQLVIGLSVEAWTALGSVAAVGMFLLAALQALLAPKAEAAATRSAPRRPVMAERSGQPALLLLHDLLGLSSAEIAAATGAAPSTVRSWIAGKHRPTGRRALLLTSLGELAIELLASMSAPEAAAQIRRQIDAAGDPGPEGPHDARFA